MFNTFSSSVSSGPVLAAGAGPVPAGAAGAAGVSVLPQEASARTSSAGRIERSFIRLPPLGGAFPQTRSMFMQPGVENKMVSFHPEFRRRLVQRLPGLLEQFVDVGTAQDQRRRQQHRIV